MREKPVLLIMAAGLGSRYGGLKQTDPVGPCGEFLLDYSLYSAWRAGFERAVLVINEKNEADFRALLGPRAGKHLALDYAFQRLDDLPNGYTPPPGREKPWGTGHAVLSARELIDAPFAVINADDYYGTEAFRILYDFLSSSEDDAIAHYCMIGFLIENTLTENGTVSRGLCTTNARGNLSGLVERTQIQRLPDGRIACTEDGKTWQEIPRGTPVSMNLFGFTPSFMGELEKIFQKALPEILRDNPLKGEFFLPTAVSALIEAGRADVRLLLSRERWYGVTYREDRPGVAAALAEKTREGVFPSPLWG